MFPVGRSNLLFRIINEVNSNCKYHSIQRLNCLSNLKNLPVIKRNFFNLFRKPSKNQLRLKDKVPDGYELIYRNIADRYIFLCQLVNGVTILVVGVVTMLDLDQAQKLQFNPNDQLKVAHKQTAKEIVVYISVFIVIYVILQLLVSQVPVRVYCCPKSQKYLSIFYGNLPFTMRRLQFQVGDVKQASNNFMKLPWTEYQYEIKDQQKIILLEQYFRRPADLFIMLGTQRDPDVEKDK
ncbi:uncharacterized protein LOC132697765 [Cylas formicarius]|uniref:uncharacterized protein LOC132697765 n=1 Tax=Cylas formicarius TaxID=197179 RepID=UPI00295832C4|nr:uncharacterized protein LOC132697765 [Cylas formicarius]